MHFGSWTQEMFLMFWAKVIDFCQHCSQLRYWMSNMKGSTPCEDKRSKREVPKPSTSTSTLLMVGGSCRWSPTRVTTPSFLIFIRGTKTASSVVCPASSIRIHPKILALQDRVVGTGTCAANHFGFLQDGTLMSQVALRVVVISCFSVLAASLDPIGPWSKRLDSGHTLGRVLLAIYNSNGAMTIPKKNRVSMWIHPIFPWQPWQPWQPDLHHLQQIVFLQVESGSFGATDAHHFQPSLHTARCQIVHLTLGVKWSQKKLGEPCGMPIFRQFIPLTRSLLAFNYANSWQKKPVLQPSEIP